MIRGKRKMRKKKHLKNKRKNFRRKNPNNAIKLIDLIGQTIFLLMRIHLTYYVEYLVSSFNKSVNVYIILYFLSYKEIVTV